MSFFAFENQKALWTIAAVVGVVFHGQDLYKSSPMAHRKHKDLNSVGDTRKNPRRQERPSVTVRSDHRWEVRYLLPGLMLATLLAYHPAWQ